MEIGIVSPKLLGDAKENYNAAIGWNEPMLTPAESLGLAGASLDSRVRRAVHHASDSTLARIAANLYADAQSNSVIYEREGVPEPVRIMLRPLLVMPEQLSYVHHVCEILVEALKRLPDLYLDDAQVRRILAITPDEDEWLRTTWTPRHKLLNPVYCRLDAVCDFTGAQWQESLQFMEPNLSGVGGIHYGPLAEHIVMRDVVPTLLAHDPELTVELPRDQRDLFLQVLLDHAHGLQLPDANLCFIEAKYVHEGPNEQSVLSRFLAERHGLTIVHADPRELRVVGDEVYFEDTRIDVVYRDYETRDLIALEREFGQPLAAMRLLFRQNRVVSSLVGDFDHKSCWELLTDETQAERFFTGDERRLFRRHVLWTRVIYPRNTTLPHGEGDLLDFIRRHREQLVIKPNRGYGGSGVQLGAAATQSSWESLIDEAVRLADDPEQSWVVQAVTRLPVHEFPVVDSAKRVFDEPYYAVMGFAPTEHGLGILCRVSQKQVVNVAQHGGLAAMLVGHPPQDLRLPKRAPVATADAEEALLRQIAELKHLDHTIGLLGWDEETYLPMRARLERGEQLATLESMRHTLLVSDRVGDLIEEVAQRSAGDAAWATQLNHLRRLRRLALALPDQLVRAMAEARSAALGAWEQARDDCNYLVFAPVFKKLLALVRERAQALAHGNDLYDALLDEYEPGITRARLDPVLYELREKLTPRVPVWHERSAQYANLLRGKRFAAAQQWEICQKLLRAMGFDFERGRIDRSTHPFTLQAGGDDVRLTIRVYEHYLPSAIFATLHEGGHGLYDQGFAEGDRDTLLAEAPSMGLHESQSRLWENHVGRSRPFWQYWFPRVAVAFPEMLGSWDAERFYRAVNFVQPGLNRVEADEATYHLHILLRYELETALLYDDLPVNDLPQAWNERSSTLLGVIPGNDRDGCLQDVHWSLGNIGYFPTYTLGSLYAAQLVEKYSSHRDLAGELASGECAPLLHWLRLNVHNVGHRYSAEEIVRAATGKDLDSGAFFRHLEAKHG